ncbi:dihydropyrimidinase [Palleronia sp. KMU-117]|uniref:dihydropyrimidinase n=1 Tax=Palleronia sp. KMU-117 TaxID=3434108 RepID=UPI003D7540EC
MPDAFDLVLRDALIVTEDGVQAGDLGVRNETIAAIGAVGGRGTHEIDAGGRPLLPGGVDPHCHIEQMSGMGLMNADTFETATRAALLGGTTTVISFAAQAKGEALSRTLSDYAARARRGAMIDHAFHITATDPGVPDFAVDLIRAIGAGHRSVKVFTTYAIRLSDRQILDILALARRAGALVCVHAENDAMIGWMKDALLASGLIRPEHHALSHPRLAEVEAVERMIRFAEFLAQPVMLFHISTAEALAAIRAARARGVPVWAETCPHYLLSTAEVLKQPGVEGAKWMCSPPQREAADCTALWDGLSDGTLDLVSSDHAPYRFDATGRLAAGPSPRFDQIANGLPGLQTRLPLLFDAMVSAGRGGLEAFARVTATAPARVYGLETKGRIAVGADADLVLWDPERQSTYGADDLDDNVGYNPWAGTTVTGWPDIVIQRGRVIAEGGHCRARPGDGRWLPRTAIGCRTACAPAPEVRTVMEE